MPVRMVGARKASSVAAPVPADIATDDERHRLFKMKLGSFALDLVQLGVLNDDVGEFAAVVTSLHG